MLLLDAGLTSADVCAEIIIRHTFDGLLGGGAWVEVDGCDESETSSETSSEDDDTSDAGSETTIQGQISLASSQTSGSEAEDDRPKLKSAVNSDYDSDSGSDSEWEDDLDIPDELLLAWDSIHVSED